jgi:hypothetical protein
MPQRRQQDGPHQKPVLVSKPGEGRVAASRIQQSVQRCAAFRHRRQQPGCGLAGGKAGLQAGRIRPAAAL